jgi:hypothetical protein
MSYSFFLFFPEPTALVFLASFPAQLCLGVAACYCGRWIAQFAGMLLDSVADRAEWRLGDAHSGIVTAPSYMRHFIVIFSSTRCLENPDRATFRESMADDDSDRYWRCNGMNQRNFH